MKLRFRMMPGTRARTSTSREPAVCPAYSKLSGKVCGVTLTTFTSGGGMPMPGGPPFFSEPFDGLHAASTSANRDAMR